MDSNQTHSNGQCYSIAFIKSFGHTMNVASVFTAGIEMVGSVSQVTRSPNLNTNGIERIYTIWGKTNLTDDVEWRYPTNSGHRFFKVMVEPP